MGLIRYSKNKVIRKVAMARISAIVVPLVILLVTFVAPEMSESELTAKFGKALSAAIAAAIVWWTAYQTKSDTSDVDPVNYEMDSRQNE